jgi:hypothetical protein
MTLERGGSRDESVKGGNQSTDTSLIHRRCIARAASADRFGKRRRKSLDNIATIRVSRVRSSEAKGADEIGRQARREADSVCQ